MTILCKESSLCSRLTVDFPMEKFKGCGKMTTKFTNLVSVVSVAHLQSQLLLCYRVSDLRLSKKQRKSTEKLGVTSLRQIQCFAQKATVSQPDKKPGKEGLSIVEMDQILSNGAAVEFKLSDFDLYSHVSIGLAGRGDEVVYEGVVRSSNSPLKGVRVVLRQLTGARAQRWGRRALQVIARLIHREELYRSYATRVHGYILPSDSSSADLNCLTLVHGYYGSYSLHQWLLCEDWLPNLEERLALDEEAVRRVGDHRTGGPTVSRQMRLIQILMRDILIGVNYLHYHGLAHTELRLKNVHISAADRHVKVGILGNAVDFPEDSEKSSLANMSTRNLMIAYDVRCVGFMMARMALRELMDPVNFAKFKAYLMKGNDPAGLREFLLPLLYTASPLGNYGLQILDRDGGEGWNLLSAMLAPKPSERISCTKALRHPFLCGPRWKAESSIETTRWGVGSAAIRIVEEYIYGNQQSNRLAQLVDLLERMNPNSRYENWVHLLQGKWRFLYHSGKHIGLTTRQANPAVLISHAIQLFEPGPIRTDRLSTTVTVVFTAMPDNGNWPYDKIGMNGKLKVKATIGLTEGKRIYPTETNATEKNSGGRMQPFQNAGIPAGDTNKILKADSGLQKQKGLKGFIPNDKSRSLPIMRVAVEGMHISLELDKMLNDISLPQRLLREVRLQVPQELFDLSRIVCATYVDARLLIFRSVSGDALLFTRSSLN